MNPSLYFAARACERAYHLSDIQDVDTDTEVALTYVEPAGAVVAFAGTESMRDALTDAAAFPSSLPNGTAWHSGILPAYDSVAPDIAAALTAHSAREVLFTGHSLGGMLALYATILAAAAGEFAWLGCITFGTPPAMNASAAQRYRQYVATGKINFSRRVVNLLDHFPGLRILDRLGYRHPHENVTITAWALWPPVRWDPHHYSNYVIGTRGM